MTDKGIFTADAKKQIQAIKREHRGKVIGFTCSCFDILHAGHCIMLKDAADQCDILVIGLQTDPTIDRKKKNKPVQSFYERKTMIQSIRYVDKVIDYATEADLVKILEELEPDVRIIGSDWKEKEFTGHKLPIKIHWHQRTHGMSTSDLRKRICKAECDRGVNSP